MQAMDNQLYAEPTYQGPNLASLNETNVISHAEPRVDHVQGQNPPYDAYPSSEIGGQNRSVAETYFHDSQIPFDFRGGSFVSVGAAFGFHPDLPIQISSQHLLQSPQPLFDDYVNPPIQFQQQESFTPSLPLADTHQPSWNARIPNSDLRQEKRVRKGQNSYDSEEEHERPETKKAAGSGLRPLRLPGACVHCKGLKVKCEFTSGWDTCNRCISGKKECVVVGRKPRRAPPKREQLLNQIREQGDIIRDKDALIKKLREKLETLETDPETGLSPTSPYSQPRSPRVQDKDIQNWIDRARESANVSCGLDPSAVSTVDEHEKFSTQSDSDDSPEEGGSPGSLLRPPIGKTRRSPAVGTALSPIGMIASSALRKKPRRGSGSSNGGNRSDVGPANESYFLPGMSTNPELRWSVRESQPPPRILASSLISPREVDKLFEIFFDRMNLSVSLLDPQIYTAQATYWRSPFLFTVICAISSRYLIERPELYTTLMGYAKIEAGQALVAGLKSPELVAGYILLSLYPVPSPRWEEERSWLMLGVAIRMATDLNLHHPSTAKITNEQQAREVANRTRIWINCYNLDRSTSTQFGKPSTIKEDYIARHSKFWYKTSGFNYDIHTHAYTQVLRVMGRFHDAIYSDPDAPTGLNKAIDFEAVTQRHEQELLDLWAEWEPRFAAESDSNSLHCCYRIELLRLVNAYSRLVILSFRFQNAFQNGLKRGNPFLRRCLDTGFEVVKTVVDRMAPHPFLRSAPDAQFVFASFSSVFLLKLLRPRFASVLEEEQKEEIIALVGRLIEVLQSKEVAIDERHTPRLYARFLAGLLERHLARRSLRSSEQPSDIGFSSGHSSTPERPYAEGYPLSQEVYQPLIVTPPSPRNNLTSILDATSTVPSTIGGWSHVAGPSVPGSLVTQDVPQDTDDCMNSAMRAISNPLFWDDMMMPGFIWTSGETLERAVDF